MKVKRLLRRAISSPKQNHCEHIRNGIYTDEGIRSINESRRNVTSHDGEDGILEYLAKKLNLSEKTCLEVGAWDGKHLSNTWNLIENHGWTGVLIEANEVKYNELQAAYTKPEQNCYLNEFIDTDKNTLDGLLDKYFKRPIDVMVIDIDGDDWYIFNSLEKYLPSVLLIEYNGSIPHEVNFVQAQGSQSPAGASLLSIIELGKQKGYEAVFATKANVILVKKELFTLLGIKSNQPDDIKPHLQYQRYIFEGFDGTIYCIGREKKVWEDEPTHRGKWIYL